jgi:DNA-binding PadR family transcriptional regulator
MLSMPLTHAVFHILLSLGDGPKHGYAIMGEVEERTDGALRLGPGTLYGALRRLRGQGLIEEVEDPRVSQSPDDERRRYYRLTGVGRAVATAEASRLQQLVEVARRKRLLGLGDGT